MFNWAIIGTGNIAKTVANEITKSGRHKVTAVYSRTYARAQKFASKYGAKVYETLEDAVNAPEVQGVYIATPHSAHYPLIKRCIELGKPILCEKSFTVNAAQTEEVVRLATEKGVYLVEAMWTRWNPVSMQVKDWVQSGAIGNVKSFSGNFSFPMSLTKAFMSNRVWLPEYAGGALLDLGVYPVSYSQMLFGTPQKIECKCVLKDGVDFDDDITLTFDGGVVCKLNCSFLHFKTYEGVIVGEKGKIVVPTFYRPSGATLFVYGQKPIKTNRGTERFGRGYVYEFDGVAKDVASHAQQSANMPHCDSVAVMKIMDECRQQAGLKYPDKIEKLR